MLCIHVRVRTKKENNSKTSLASDMESRMFAAFT